MPPTATIQVIKAYREKSGKGGITPSLFTLCRKLKRYQEGGFDNLARKKRSDQGKPRNTSSEVIEKAIELKKEQPRRSPQTINFFLIVQLSEKGRVDRRNFATDPPQNRG